MMTDLEKIIQFEETRKKNGYKSGWVYHKAVENGILGAFKEYERQQKKGAAASQRKDLSPLRELRVELIPKTCWGSNVRSVATKVEWNTLRDVVFERAEHVCQICGDDGNEKSLHCHEVWEYEDASKVQKLKSLMPVCPACHEVIHFGRTIVKRNDERAVNHLRLVNQWSDDEIEKHIKDVSSQCMERSDHEWFLDLTHLSEYGIVYESHERIKPLGNDEEKLDNLNLQKRKVEAVNTGFHIELNVSSTFNQSEFFIRKPNT